MGEVWRAVDTRLGRKVALKLLRRDEQGESEAFVRQVRRMLREARFDEVRAAIEALPSKQKAAVLMHKYQEMDYAQIARVLACSESAVKSLLFRAYETLRSRLAHMA